MKYASLSATILAAAMLTACNDGPAENAGEDVDDAIEEVTGEDSDTFEEAGENVDDATDEDPGRQ